MNRIRALCAHLESSPAAASSGSTPPQPPQHPEGVTVAVLSHAGAAHVTAYLDGLAVVSEVDRVVLADPDGAWVEEAEERLGDKLAAVYTDHEELLESEDAVMALVSMVAVLAPPVISAALKGGCHVLAEKPSSVSAASIKELEALADSEGKMLMLALANRLCDPPAPPLTHTRPTRHAPTARPTPHTRLLSAQAARGGGGKAPHRERCHRRSLRRRDAHGRRPDPPRPRGLRRALGGPAVALRRWPPGLAGNPLARPGDVHHLVRHQERRGVHGQRGGEAFRRGGLGDGGAAVQQRHARHRHLRLLHRRGALHPTRGSSVLLFTDNRWRL